MTILVIARDVLIVAVALVLYLAAGVRKFPPSALSKVNTIFQVLAVGLVLVSASFPTLRWIELTAARLSQLAEAWRDPEAWTGTSAAGGVEMPSPVTGRVAINEVLVHGWDLARSTGQPYDPHGGLVAAGAEFVEPMVAQSPEGIPGLFGPAVAVPPEAPPLDRLLGATGRNPAWQPET